MEALQCILFFLLLINVGCHDWPLWGWKCPEDKVEDCFCKYDRYVENERFLSCGYSYTIKDYVSGMKRNGYSKNMNLDIRFYGLRKTPNEMPSNIFEGLNIRTLVFEKCNITKWGDKDQAPAFVGLEDTLEYLKIQESITRPGDTEDEVAAFTIRHLRKLKELDLRSNKLTTFKNDWLGDGLGDSLVKVSLYNNWIWDLSDDTFSRLEKLEYIDLSYNRISKLSRNMFPNPARYLMEINLKGNKVAVLPTDFFENMPALMDINFIGNQIMVIDETTWRPVWSQLRQVLIKVPSLHCYKEKIQWMFKVKSPVSLSGNCYFPEELRGKSLSKLIEENQ